MAVQAYCKGQYFANQNTGYEKVLAAPGIEPVSAPTTEEKEMLYVCTCAMQCIDSSRIITFVLCHIQ